jgi:RNA polymerase sigma-70 factor (ECF subfamily)
LRDDATLRDELNALTPRLRRYARALVTGSPAPSDVADDLVHSTLMRALGARHIGAPSDLLIRLYATVTQLNRDVALSGQQVRAAGSGRPTLIVSGRNFSSASQTKLSAGLMALPLEGREAVLLVGLEGFDYGEAARILRISRGVLVGRLTQARSALDSALRAAPNALGSQKTPRPSGVPYLRLVT